MRHAMIKEIPFDAKSISIPHIRQWVSSFKCMNKMTKKKTSKIMLASQFYNAYILYLVFFFLKIKLHCTTKILSRRRPPGELFVDIIFLFSLYNIVRDIYQTYQSNVIGPNPVLILLVVQGLVTYIYSCYDLL